MPKCFENLVVVDLKITELQYRKVPNSLNLPLCNLDNMAKVTKNLKRMLISLETFVKNCKLSIKEDRYTDDLVLPVNYIKLTNYTTFYLHENVLPAF